MAIKILGYELKKSEINVETPMTKPSTQTTKPSKPTSRGTLRAELGDTGIRGVHGIIAEDYNPNLQGVQAIRVYDEMRRSDGTVRASILVTTLPIRRAKWFVNPVTQDEKDKEIATFVEHALFDWIDSSWDDIIRQALLMIPFGVMVFEKVYGTIDHEGKTYVNISKLAPRLPKSIQRWELEDGTFGIQQIRQDGVIAEIPGSKLLIFVNEKEGDNWWGTSMLRAAYKHWYYKNNFYKIDAVAFERQGLGIPLIKMPKGYTESDLRKAQQALTNLRAHEEGYLILPPDYEAEFMNMGASSTRDPQNSINHHNKEILQSVLAQFLELGQTASTGSKALSQDHSDIFLKAMEAIAFTIISEVNKNLIPELVDMNYDNVIVYPKLDFEGISKTDVKALSEAFASFVTSKAITPTMKDQTYLRALMGLPEITEDDMEESGVDNIDIDTPDPKDKVDPNEVIDPKKDVTVDPKNNDAEKKKEDMKAHEHVKRVRKYADDNGFMSWRKLTFAEEKVNFSQIEDHMNQLQEKFTKEAEQLLNDAKDSFMSKIQKALEDDDKKTVSELEIKFVQEYKKLLKDFMKEAYEYGKSNASVEMKVKTPANNSGTLASIDLLADTIAWKAASDIEAKAKTSVVNGLKKMSDLIAKNREKYASIIQVVGMIDAMIEDSVTKVVSAAAGLIINQAINMGRKDVFDKNQDKIYALQRSEILDEDTCDFCLSMDGRIIEPDDKWGAEDSFHTNCRGIWVEIMKEEPELPEIDGIPENVADYYGGEPNALIQPPKPIVRPDSPALEEVQRRQEEKKKNKK